MTADMEREVWRRADDRCEYCQVPQSIALVPHQIDHIIAKKHAGKTGLDNLALSCFYCNNYKGPNIASLDPESAKLTRLFHPRSDRWDDHFRLLIDGRMEGRTDVGRTTVFVMNMNESDAIFLRWLLILEGLLDNGSKS